MSTLKEKMGRMEEEMVTFTDLERCNFFPILTSLGWFKDMDMFGFGLQILASLTLSIFLNRFGLVFRSCQVWFGSYFCTGLVQLSDLDKFGFVNILGQVWFGLYIWTGLVWFDFFGHIWFDFTDLKRFCLVNFHCQIQFWFRSRQVLFDLVSFVT